METPPPTFVSILIPCYNAARWVQEAVESALAQTHPHIEVIVVDDGSTDGSVEILRGFGDRIRWETGPNRGGNVARNRLLELSRGEWLQYLDADDALEPGKIARQMAFLKENPEVDIVYSPVTYLVQYPDRPEERYIDEIPAPHDPYVHLASWKLPQTGAPLWRKAAVRAVGGWKPEQPCCQEHELYLRLLLGGARFAYFGETGALYRQWSDGTVCKRNIPLVHEKRLEVEERLEAFLTEKGMLTPARRQALSQARFEIARGMWAYDRKGAEALIKRTRKAHPGFVPGGPPAPPAYRLVWRLLGFSAAERIAAWRRSA